MKTLGGSHVAAGMLGCLLTNMTWYVEPDARFFLVCACVVMFLVMMVSADYESGVK